MAQAHGPDPNRFPSNDDPDLTVEEEAHGGGLVDPRSTRLGLSSWGIALVAVALLVLFLVLMR